MNNIIPGSFKLMKKINTGLIIDTIRMQGPIARAEIAKLLNLTPATVTNITAELIDKNLITEGELGVSSGGRKPIMLKLNNDTFFVIAVQVDITYIRAVLLNTQSIILDDISTVINAGLSDDNIIQIIEGLINKIILKNCIEKSKIPGLGISINGIVNSESGVILYSPVFQSENINLRYILEKEFDLPVYIDRDVRAMALGESWIGEGKNVETFVCIMVGRGICSAIINNKQLIRGANDGLGEIGHMKICSNGLKCRCGGSGCLEEYASEKAILRYACDSIPELYTDLQEIHKASISGNKEVIDAIEKAGEFLGIGISNIINAFNPALIIIGGEFICKNDYYFDSMIKSAKNNSLKQLFDCISIKKAVNSNDSVIKGTGILVLIKLFES